MSEILSPSTERADRGAKRDVYARIWRLPEYFVVDPASGLLEGWDLDRRARAFVAKQPDERGDLPVHALGLALGVRELSCGKLGPPSLRWIDRDGPALPTGRERAAAAERELARLRARG